MFTALSENFGNLRDKLNIFVAVAPITNLYYSTNTQLKKAANNYQAYELALSKVYQFHGPNFEKIRTVACLVLPCDLIMSLANPSYAPFNDDKVVDTVNVRYHSPASTK